jgi:hypothetical protein
MAADPKLTQEQIDQLIARIDRIERKRRIMLAGYLTAAVMLILGQVLAFVVFARAASGQFVGWVFFIPFTLVGVALWAFGRWANRQTQS